MHEATASASGGNDDANNGANHGSNHKDDNQSGPSVVDWDLAVATAQRLTRSGPDVSREQARKVVTDLREFAVLAEGHVREYTGLHAEGATAPVLVVDRQGWVQANADGFRELLTPLSERLRQRQGPSEQMSKMGSAFGSRVTALEAGALLGYLSGRVLGQFDPFWAEAGDGSDASVNGSVTAGRLLLVAPNVVHIERELDVDSRDFRLWVCVHEETHRVQFTAVPWLRDHLRDEIAKFLAETDLDPSAVFGQLRDSFDNLGKALRGGGEGISLVDLVQSPTQKEILDRLTAVMSLLEGHADVVMDGVGPDVIPTVEKIRERFQERRKGGTFADQFLKRLLGMDKKLAQYRDGAKFVRHVVDRVGMTGFNRVWESPATLPSKDEIADPDAWLRRVPN